MQLNQIFTDRKKYIAKFLFYTSPVCFIIGALNPNNILSEDTMDSYNGWSVGGKILEGLMSGLGHTLALPLGAFMIQACIKGVITIFLDLYDSAVEIWHTDFSAKKDWIYLRDYFCGDKDHIKHGDQTNVNNPLGHTDDIDKLDHSQVTMAEQP